MGLFMKISFFTVAVSLLASTLVLTACGGGGNNTAPNTSNTKTTPPQQIGFNLPSTLISSSSAARSPKYAARLQRGEKKRVEQTLSPVATVSAEQSYAYEELKAHLSDANFRRLETNVTLVYLNGIWSQVEQQCANVAVDSRCEIPANTISFTYTQDILDAEYALYADQTDYFSSGDLLALQQQMQSALGFTFTLGEIHYTVHSSGDFTHDITVDMSSIEQVREQSTNVFLKQMAKWNDDKTRVATGYLYIDSSLDQTFSSLIDWDKTTDFISYQDTSRFNTSTTTFTSKVSRLNDGKDGVAIDSTWRVDDSSSESFSYSSSGTVNSDGGHLNSSITYLGDTFYNEETFDGSGVRTGGKFCDSTTTDCSDKANWTDALNLNPIQDDPADPNAPVIEDIDLVEGAVEVTNIPADLGFFIVTNGDVIAPTIDDVICIGASFQYDTESHTDIACWSDRLDEIDANAKVFKEEFNDTVDISEDFFIYTEIPAAIVTRLD